MPSRGIICSRSCCARSTWCGVASPVVPGVAGSGCRSLRFGSRFCSVGDEGQSAQVQQGVLRVLKILVEEEVVERLSRVAPCCHSSASGRFRSHAEGFRHQPGFALRRRLEEGLPCRRTCHWRTSTSSTAKGRSCTVASLSRSMVGRLESFRGVQHFPRLIAKWAQLVACRAFLGRAMPSCAPSVCGSHAQLAKKVTFLQEPFSTWHAPVLSASGGGLGQHVDVP